VPGDEPGWAAFEERLAAALARMRPETFLVLLLPSREPGGSGPYVQFAHSGPRGFRAEASANPYLAPRHELTADDEARLVGMGWQRPAPAGDDDRNFHLDWPSPAPWHDVAGLAVRTLRDVFGIDGPGSLRFLHRGFPAFEGRLPRLGLGLAPQRASRGQRDPAADPSPALAGLSRRLEDALKSFLGLEALVRDADGDIPVRIGSALMYVRVLPGTPPLVQLFAHVLEDVDLTLPLLEALNDINRRILFGRMFWGHRRVVVAMELTGVGLAPEQVAFACMQLGNLADHLDNELRERFGPPDGERPTRRLVN
jgi:hypothetical protein